MACVALEKIRVPREPLLKLDAVLWVENELADVQEKRFQGLLRIRLIWSCNPLQKLGDLQNLRSCSARDAAGSLDACVIRAYSARRVR